jgi:CheY-like chemotaxis protein
MPRPTILVADRNSRIVNLLRRELTLAGYRVLTAGTVSALLDVLGRSDGPDLLVLDPELPDTRARNVLSLLQITCPGLPILLHCLPPLNGLAAGYRQCWPIVVEKGGDSVERLQQAICRMLPADRSAGG